MVNLRPQATTDVVKPSDTVAPMPSVPQEDQKDAIKAWLNEKWKDPTCPVCGTVGWGASDVLEIPVYGYGRTSESRVTPVSSIMCLECGYTMFFNAILAGLIDTKPEGAPDGD